MRLCWVITLKICNAIEILISLIQFNSGRSIVIHKKNHNLRWACSTLERGYSPQEAREIRAIASFHHPYGYAYGYIRFTQLIHNDGSKSDTVIEVKLQYPGENDRNIVICQLNILFPSVRRILLQCCCTFRHTIIIGIYL